VGMSFVIHVHKNSVLNVIFAARPSKGRYVFISVSFSYKNLSLDYKMTSIARSFAQRNTNSSQIIPVFEGTMTDIFGDLSGTPFGDLSGSPFGDLSGAAYYTLNLPKVQSTGGSFFVDLDGVDASGNLIDLNGSYVAGGGYIYNTNFIVNVPIDAAYVTNMEFTIFFKNFTRFNGPFTIGIISTSGAPFPYTFSPPVPVIFGYTSPSITFKSDGTQYTAVASGPAGWLGPYLIASLVNSIGNINPVT